MRSPALIAFATLSFSAPAAAVPTPAIADAKWLEGEWRGGGTSFGAVSKATLNVRPALGGKFLELTYTVSTVGGPNPLSFEGRAYYKPAGAEKWQAWWFDNQGASLPISATLSGEQLTAEWGSPGTRRGRTVYRRLDDGKIEVVDWALQKDGRLREFARQQFEKAR